MTTPSFRVAASRLFSSHLSSLNPWFAFFSVMFLVALHMLATEFHDWVAECLGHSGRYAIFVVFMVIFFALWLTARSAPKQRLDVERLEDPVDCKCKALILFLSRPNDHDLAWFSADPLTADINQQGDRERLQSGWRMAIEAIREHLGDPLKVIYVIGSSGDKGTAPHLPLFRKVVLAYCAGQTNPPKVQIPGSKLDGFDFLDGKQIQIAINQAFRELHTSGIEAKDVILDVTGGYGICSAIAGAASMDEPHRFQHVAAENNDPHNKFKVVCYRVRYLDDPNAAH